MKVLKMSALGCEELLDVMEKDVTQLSVVVGPCTLSVFEGFNIISVLT